MANTLKDDMAADLAGTFLNTKEFAETVTFYPADGSASRSIVMIVVQNQKPEDNGPVNYETETIDVQCLKDESHAKGGIATPTRGLTTSVDKLVRAGDTEDERFAFTGEILGETFGGAGWRLRFERSKARQIGSQR